ncbi:hypothetical protein M9458_053410, partial [Cirrhinus mrigala]
VKRAIGSGCRPALSVTQTSSASDVTCSRHLHSTVPATPLAIDTNKPEISFQSFVRVAKDAVLKLLNGSKYPLPIKTQ